MRAVKISEDVQWWCRLLERDIAEGACYEINMVNEGIIKTTAVDVPAERLREARNVCPSCVNRPI